MSTRAVHIPWYRPLLSRNYVRPSAVLSQTVAIVATVHVAESLSLSKPNVRECYTSLHENIFASQS